MRVPAREVSRWFPAGTELRVMPVKQFDALVQDATEGSTRQRTAHPAAVDPRPTSRTVELGCFVGTYRNGRRGGIIGTG